MLNENLKELRKRKGISQEELANQFHVVRQTISKWEKGLSVPDATMLIKLADYFKVTVSELLGGELLEHDDKLTPVAEQLAKINEQLAVRNRRSRRILKTILIFFITWVVIIFLVVLLGVVNYSSNKYLKTITKDEIIVSPE